MTWFVYILECCNGELYTGSTTDVSRRIQEHSMGIGSRFTSGRLPVRLIYHERFADRSAAQQREFEIKKMSKSAKLALVGTRNE